MSLVEKYFIKDEKTDTFVLKPISKEDKEKQDRFKIKHPEGYDDNAIKSSLFDKIFRKQFENLLLKLVEKFPNLGMFLVDILSFLKMKYLLFTDEFLFLELKHDLILNYRRKDTSLNIILSTRTKDFVNILNELCNRKRWDLILKAYDTYLQFRLEESKDYEEIIKNETNQNQ